MKHYFIAGTFWRMRELRGREDAQVKVILSRVNPLTNFSPEEITVLIDKMYETGAVADTFNIVLRHEYGMALYNTIVLKLRRTKRKDLTALMTKRQIARVLADFFALNGRWMIDCFSIDRSSALQKIGNLTKLNLFSRKSQPLLSQMETRN